MRKFFLAIFSLLVSSLLYAESDICLNESIGKLPTYSEGRLKPTIVLANKVLSNIEVNSSVSKVICKLSHGDRSALKEMKLDGRPVEDLITSIPKMREQLLIVSEDKRKVFYSKFESLRNIEDLLKGDLWKIQSSPNNFNNWLKISNLEGRKSSHLINLLEENMIFSSADSLKVYIEYLHETYYFDGIILFIISILSILSMFFTIPAKLILFSLCMLSFLPIITRIILSGRAPITNMYETVGFTAFSVVIFSFIARFKGHKLHNHALVFTLLSYLLLVVGVDLFNGQIIELRPVLRDNFWLSTHVVFIILAYGMLSLSWIMSLHYSLRFDFDLAVSRKKLLLNIIKIGCIFLFAGICLGAVWADKAWGRFWAWDPKETWSLICVAIYMALIHWDLKKKIASYHFFVLVNAAYSTVVMAWFGVNYLIATGMHTYGFQEGKGVSFVIGTLSIQIIFLANRYLKRKNYE